jgi:hypothetical protein
MRTLFLYSSCGLLSLVSAVAEATVNTLSSGELVVLNTFSCESLIVVSSSSNEDTILELSSKNRMSSHTTGVRSQARPRVAKVHRLRNK